MVAKGEKGKIRWTVAREKAMREKMEIQSRTNLNGGELERIERLCKKESEGYRTNKILIK